MTEPADPFANDPFFRVIPDGDWNALIGRQGHEENYLDGYMEAAIELADAIFEKKLFGKRDTLVLPILYNARHGVELALKFATEHLVRAKAIRDDQRSLSHNIGAYWAHLNKENIGDEKLAQAIKALKPFIDSLAQVDSDGQELRYHRNRENDRSLSKFGTVNLRLVRKSLGELQELLSTLKYRTLSYLDDFATGTCTDRCSRSDLMQIAQMLPPRADWNSAEFDARKATIKARYALGSRQFSLAVEAIEKSREMRGILGVETSLMHLTDEDIVWVVQQWRLIHPPRDPSDNDTGLDYFDTSRLAAMKDERALYQRVISSIVERMDADKVADLETLFYLERDRHFSEVYEQMVADTLKEHGAANDRSEEVRHLIEKTNFLQCIRGAAKRLGRLELAKALEAL